jgi:hypothetical protein
MVKAIGNALHNKDVININAFHLTIKKYFFTLELLAGVKIQQTLSNHVPDRNMKNAVRS